jgi:formylmethanofuran dehydrogenase subunit E
MQYLTLIYLNLKLHIIKGDDLDDYSSRNRFSFAVIDLLKSKNYPSNFVCLLPERIRKDKAATVFEKLFREKSFEQAVNLLTEMLKSAEDSEVRVEIQRRLKLLSPIKEIRCDNCGKMFLPKRLKRFKHNFCGECFAKKYGSN